MQRTKDALLREIEDILVVIRKQLAIHKGGVELVDFEPSQGLVSVRLTGMCVGCPMSDLTLKAGIEGTLKELIPEVQEVIAVTDSIPGKNESV